MRKLRYLLLNKLLIVLVTFLCLAALILFTDPNKVALPVLIMPFLLIGCLIYQVTLLIVNKNHKLGSGYAKRLVPLSVASLGVSLLLLRSLHQLTIKDSLLTFGFTLVFWLYIWRADFLHTTK